MDEFEDINWKKLQKIVNKYTGVSFEGHRDHRKVNPILAHSCFNPVRLNPYSNALLSDLLIGEDNFYCYASSLIEKLGRYETKTEAFLLSPMGDIPVMRELKTFKKTESKNIVLEELTLPLSYFVRDKHIKVMTFKNSEMPEEDFNNIIEIWRKQ